LAPFYLGLALSLIVLFIKFATKLLHIVRHAFTSTEQEVILGVRALVDLTLTGSLLIIVILSGYENFVSRIDHSGHRDWPEWMGKIDFGALKLKLLSSIVAISAIQLLKQFMSIEKVSDRDLIWLVVIHVVLSYQAFCWRFRTRSPQVPLALRSRTLRLQATARVRGQVSKPGYVSPARTVPCWIT
jgi:uncharacterized protein (TIGR00645 family)